MRLIRAIPSQVIPLGRLGENECTQILFDVSEWLEEHPSCAIGLYNLRPEETDSYPVSAIEIDGNDAVWTIKNSDLAIVGRGRCELVAIEGNTVVKSAIYATKVLEALDGNGEAPEPWEDWKEDFIELKDEVEAAAEAAQDASEAIQNMGVEANTLAPESPATVAKNVDPETGAVTLTFGIPEGKKGEKGDKGDRGYSPTATVSKNGKTATITLTDIDKTTTATINDGNDGFSPEATVLQLNNGARITITDKNGTTFATVNDGEDGYSPSATVVKKDYGARVTITDKTGTTFADVYNGEKGNGIVSAVLNNNYTLTLEFADGTYTTVGPIRGEKGIGITSVEKTGTSGLVDTYTITFDDGSTTTFTVTNGESVEFHICTSAEYDVTTRVPTIQNPSTSTFYLVPAEDGSSPDLFVEWIWTGTTWEMFGSATIDLSNYVQFTDYASPSKAGVVKVNPSFGITASGSTLLINPAVELDIKGGTTGFKPIPPLYQHVSAFYGLAKAAGDTTQSQSSNPVGTYTNEAKSAIRSMIDATSREVTVQDEEPTDEDVKIWLPETQPESVQVPTVEEMNAAIAAIEVPVDDVQVNGTSIVNNGVANIPVASAISLGVMSTNNQYGIDMYGQHPCISAAAVNKIKEGTDPWRPIVPDRLDSATFYGLAKAAGADMKNITPTTVGVYPDEQKGAIQDMLGISDLLAPIETDYLADRAYAVGDVFTNNGKLYKVISAITENGAIVVQDYGETISGANAVQCKLGEETIKDVQVNGTSVLQDGVANMPVVGNEINSVGKTVGMVRFKDGYCYGFKTFLNGNDYCLALKAATESGIKTGKIQNTNGYGVIDSTNINSAAFYGLAKAAGDATQAASSNAVGTYTDEAKSAIKRMLGITQTLTVTAQTQDGVTVTGQTVTVRADDASGEVYASSAYEGQPVSFSLPSGFQYYVSISDTLAHHFNPTTARGVITNADASVTLQYTDVSSIHTAADIKAALDANMDLTDLVGESITCTRGADTLTWDVADYDATNKRVTLLLHDVFGSANMIFEPTQALMWCENGLAAGNYTFKWNTTQVYFTLTTAIPAGGQLRATDSAFSTYESQSATSTLETGTVSTTEISGATDLGATGSGLLNHHDRVSYGSNNYVESALFWWLNSDAPANTQRVPVTKFSRAYSYNVAGFLNGLDESFVSAIDNAVWKCSTNNVYECPASLGGATPGKQNSYTVTAKIGLASEMEVFGSYDGTADGSVVFDLYNDATADDRKKYRGTSTQIWWLRSPYWSTAYGERYVYASGNAVSGYSRGSSAVVPACQISQSTGN